MDSFGVRVPSLDRGSVRHPGQTQTTRVWWRRNAGWSRAARAALAVLIGGSTLLTTGRGPVEADVLVNDPMYGQQWGMGKIGAPTAWSTTTGSSSVILAVVDTGIATAHPEFAGRLLPGKNTMDGSSNVADDHGRGTHLAGIAAARGNNGVGVAGLAWEVKVLPVKAAGPYGTTSVGAVTWADGIRHAVDRGARVVLIGGTTGYHTLIESAVQYALQRGVVVVAPVGDLARRTTECPACFPGVLAVGATNQIDRMGHLTNYGAGVTIMAPGEGIVSTAPTGSCRECDRSGYRVATSTSRAAGHVAGAAALLFAAHPEWTGAQVRDRLRSTTDALDPLHASYFPNAGRLNVAKALGASVMSLQPPSAPSSLRAGTIGTTSIQVLWNDNADNEGQFEFAYRSLGTLSWSLRTIGSNVTSDTIGGLASGASYEAQVRACNTAGCSGWSNLLTAATASTVTIPTSPSNLRAGTIGSSSIQTLWNDNSSNESRFELVRRAKGTSSWSTRTLGTNVTSDTISGLASGVSYEFMVRSCNTAGCSGWSNLLTATTSSSSLITTTMPSAPSNLRAGTITTSSLQVLWTDTSSNESRFELTYSPAAVRNWKTLQVATNLTSATVTGLTSMTGYLFYVRACNAAGCSSWSNVLSTSTK